MLQYTLNYSVTDRANVEAKQFLRAELSSSYGKEYSDEQVINQVHLTSKIGRAQNGS